MYIYTNERKIFFDNIFTYPKLIFNINSLIMCSLSTTQKAVFFHPDSRVNAQKAYNCVDNFLDSLEEEEIKEDIVSESKKNTMIDLAIQVLTKQNDLHFRTIWIEIEKLGYKTPRGGKTPWATLGSELRRRDDIFKKLGKGIYGLHTYKTIK